jgi:hypothetical protein
MASPLVASAVDENGKPNFQVIDDDPTPDQILAAKKAALITQVRVAESVAKQRIAPEGKVRAFGARHNAVVAADTERAATLLEAQPVGALSAIGIGAKKDRGKARTDAEAARPPDDAKFMADQAERQARIAAVEALAIQMESDIEDLTAANIDQWQLTPFQN